jgi:type I site-specific restriction endonuclease
MKDVTIPLPHFLEEQIAEVEVKINGKKRKFNFRIESFQWESDPLYEHDPNSQITAKIERLKQNIESYDKSWELIQIFAPAENAKRIQVLFRQREII